MPIVTETASAVFEMKNIASQPGVAAITWGCEDLSAFLGALGNRDPCSKEYLDVFKHCRLQTLLAAKAAGVQAIDGVYADVRDSAGFGAEVKDAVFMGFDGKLTLHPSQIQAVHKAFRPGEQAVQEAKEVVGGVSGGGVSGCPRGRSNGNYHFRKGDGNWV